MCKLYGEMHRFIPIYASWSGARVTEIPVEHHARTMGKSKYGLSRTIKVVFDLMTIKFMASYQTKPLYVFGWRRHADFASPCSLRGAGLRDEVPQLAASCRLCADAVAGADDSSCWCWGCNFF